MREIGIILVGQLNLRSVQSADDEHVIGTLHRGDKVEILEHRPGLKAKWLRVQSHEDGTIGWAVEENKRERFIRIDVVAPDAPLPPPEPQWPEPKIIKQDNGLHAWPFVIAAFAAVIIITMAAWLFR